MKDFNDLWRDIIARSQSFPVVQDRTELEYVYSLMEGCESYLEVGTAEGNSLYLLSHALAPKSQICYVDLDEKHTREPREWVVAQLDQRGHHVHPVHGNSNDFITAARAKDKYDIVMIDAGHSLFNVTVDAILYGPMARKFIIFHDVQMPEVNAAFEWYAQQRKDCRMYRIVNSTKFGYGILEVMHG